MSGTAMRTMCSGFDRMTSVWPAKMRISVRRSPMVVALSNLWMKVFSKYSLPWLLMTLIRVRMPPASGMTTKRRTLKKSVLYGTSTWETPRRNFTIGTKRTRMMRSFVATWTTVYAGFPFVRELQTKTMAVQGAAPKSTAPARYCVAMSGAIHALNTTKRKKLAMPYMVNGLMTMRPFGFFPISLTLSKSTFIIMG